MLATYRGLSSVLPGRTTRRAWADPPSRRVGASVTDVVSWHTFGILGVGVGSGVLSALAGVGGAVVSTPGIRALGASPIVSVGSTVPAIIPSAITGAIRYSKQGLVDWRVGLGCGSAGAVSSMLGAWASDHVDARWLMVLTALLVLWSSVSVLRKKPAPAPVPSGVAQTSSVPEVPHPRSQSFHPGRLVLIGLGAGFVAGLLGVGGGIVLVPAFTLFLGMEVKQTIATSLIAVAMMSTTSLIAHSIEGHVHWAYALPLVIGVIPGARIGSKIAVAASQRTMQLVCGWLLLILGLVYLATELSKL